MHFYLATHGIRWDWIPSWRLAAALHQFTPLLSSIQLAWRESYKSNSFLWKKINILASFSASDASVVFSLGRSRYIC